MVLWIGIGMTSVTAMLVVSEVIHVSTADGAARSDCRFFQCAGFKNDNRNDNRCRAAACVSNRFFVQVVVNGRLSPTINDKNLPWLSAFQAA